MDGQIYKPQSYMNMLQEKFMQVYIQSKKALFPCQLHAKRSLAKLQFPDTVLILMNMAKV